MSNIGATIPQRGTMQSDLDAVLADLIITDDTDQVSEPANTPSSNGVVPACQRSEEDIEFDKELTAMVKRVKTCRAVSTSEIIQVSPASRVHVTTSHRHTQYDFGFSFKTLVKADDYGRSWAVHQITDVEEGTAASEIGLRRDDEIVEIDEVKLDGMYHGDVVDQFLIIEWPEISLVISRQDATYLVEAKLALQQRGESDTEHVVAEIFSMVQEADQVVIPDLGSTGDCQRVSRVSKQITILDQTAEKPALVLHLESQWYIQVQGGKIVVGPLTERSTNLSHCMYKGIKSARTRSFGQLITFQTSEGRKTAYISATSAKRIALKKSEKVGRYVKFLNADDPRLFFRHSYETWTCFYVAQFARQGKLMFLACKRQKLYLKSLSHCEAQTDPDVQFKLM